MLTGEDLDDEGALDALGRVLASEGVRSSPQIQAVLQFLVQQELAGRGDQIKAYSIAVDVLQRPTSFDPQNDSTVRVVAGRLRRLLDAYYEHEGREDPIRIEIPKGGYRPVFQKQNGSSSASSDEFRTRPGFFQGSRSRWVLVSSVIGLLLILGFAFWQLPTRQEPMPESVSPRPPVIGIALFADLTDDERLGSFAFGLQFDLVSKLSAFSWLAVFVEREVKEVDSRIGNPRYPPEGPHVDYILTGAVYIDDESMIISYHLSEVETQLVRWAKTYKRSLSASSLFSIQRDAATDIAVEIGRPEGVVAQLELAQSRKGPKDLNAYLCVLRMYDYWRSFLEATHRDLRACLEQAILADPDYAEAYAALSFLYLDEFRYEANKRQEYDALQKSLAMARRAVELEPFSTLANQALYTASVIRGDLDRFESVGRNALALSPHNPELLADFGNKLAIRAGEWEEALLHTQRALGLNPDPAPWYFLTPAYQAILAADYREALRWTNRMNTPQWLPYHLIRSIAFSELGDDQAKEAELQQLMRFDIGDQEAARRKILELKFDPDLGQSLIDGLTRAYKADELSG